MARKRTKERKRTKDKTRKPGRPKGTGSSGNPPAVTTAEAVRCPACGSTQRSKYHGTVERMIAGTQAGRPHTHIIWRRCACLDCGRHRVEKTYENRPAGG